MKEPQRLSESGATSLVRTLVQSGQGEAPSEAGVQRMLTAAAVGTTATAAALGASAAGPTAAGIAGAAANSASATTPLVVVKWLGIGIVSGLATIGAVDAGVALFDEPPPTVHTPSRTTPVLAPSRKVSLPATESTKTADVIPPEEEKRVVAPLNPKTPAAVLAEETRLVDGARAALASGNPARALAALNNYAVRFPKGRLAAEAAFLRMEALAASGDRAGAKAAAQHVLDSESGKMHSERAKSMLEDDTP